MTKDSNSRTPATISLSRWLVFLAGRLLFVVPLLFASLYCILAQVPFVNAVLQGEKILPMLNAAVSGFPGCFTIGVAGFLISLASDRPAGTVPPARGRWIRWFLLCTLPPTCGIVWASSPLEHVGDDTFSLLGSFVALLPLLLAACMDLFDLAGAFPWNSESPDEDYPIFRAAFYSAILLALIYTVIVYVRGNMDWTVSTGLAAAIWSFVSHLLAAAFLFTLFNWTGIMCGWFRKPTLAAFVATHVLFASATYLVVSRLLFASLSFSGWLAEGYAIVLAATLATLSAGLALRSHQRQGGPILSGLALSLWIQPAPTKPRFPESVRTVARLGLASVLSVLAVTEFSTMDWNFVLQQLVVLGTWIAVFRVFYSFARFRQKDPSHTALMLLACLAVLASHRSLQANSSLLWSSTDAALSHQQFLDRYSGYDVSFRLIHDAVAPPEYTTPDYYKFLAANTSIPRNVEIPPTRVDLVEDLTPRPGSKPNIFIFAIDSLRQDYLSPYNPRVHFTPNLDRFAKESLVLKNAFSRYGGTLLAEPSIWAGAMLLHRQSQEPFAPMNNLEKLLLAEDYHSYVSMDALLRPLLTPNPNMQELDEGVFTMDLDLCRSLDELEQKLVTEAETGAPVFAYTQPQNLHISVLQRQGGVPLTDKSYGRFFAPYASRVERIDACFGQFIQTLKDQGIYDNSIIVFTADHGDSLGDGGRWGHAYTIYPEILKIPLIIHVPVRMRRSVYFDAEQIAFSTDITPTLYYLLGHTGILHNEFLGKPLLTATKEEHEIYLQPRNLVASSYGPLWGILTGDSQSLYVSDSVNHREYFFELDHPQNALDVRNAIKAEYQFSIQEKVAALGRMYHYDSESR